MSTSTRDRASAAEIAAHLRRCDASFVPPLSTRVEIDAYAARLYERAVRFEAWDGTDLVALVAIYTAPGQDRAFISNVSVDPDHLRHGLARTLVARACDHARADGATSVALEVGADNRPALDLYASLGFTPDHLTLTLEL